MASFDRRYAEVLAPVVEAGRAALRRLDDDEVPAKLKRVARSTGKGLPTPLAVSLLAEVDSSEWLRSKVLEEYEAVGRSDDAAEAFLRRGKGWWPTVTSAIAAAERRAVEADVLAARAEAAAAQSRLEAARGRERRNRERIAALEEGGDGDDSRISQLRAALDRERRRGDEAEDRVRRADDELRALAGQIADLEERQGQLYDRMRRLRTERADLERRLTGGERRHLPVDPLGIARWLDDASRVLAPYRPAEPGGEEAAGVAETDALRLPSGVRPDTAEAIEALRSLRPRRVFVDGHNVIGAVDHRAIGDAATRHALVADLGLLARAVAPAGVVVVFDSALGGARETIEAAPGLTVRFSPPADAADDVIVEEAVELGSGTVVISNDREVRERSAEGGALPLWSDALVAWLAEAKRAGIGT